MSTQQSESTVTTSAPPRRIGLMALVAAVALALDVITKVLVVANLEGKEPVRLLGGLVYLQVIRNSGAAFSIGTGLTWLFSMIMIGVVLVVVWIARQLRSQGWAIGLGLVLAGALGNLTDRLFRAPGPFLGHVVDFVSVFSPNGHTWPIFNVADASINIGGAVVVIMALLGRYYDGRSTRDKPASGARVEPAAAQRARQAMRAAGARASERATPQVGTIGVPAESGHAAHTGDGPTVLVEPVTEPVAGADDTTTAGPELAGAGPAEQHPADAEATTRIRRGSAEPTEVLKSVAPEQENARERDEPDDADEVTRRLPVPPRTRRVDERTTSGRGSSPAERPVDEGHSVADEPTTELDAGDVGASSSATRDGR
ncbi:MAG: signal peptidase II [Sciscionella sp.]